MCPELFFGANWTVGEATMVFVPLVSFFVSMSGLVCFRTETSKLIILQNQYDYKEVSSLL